MNHVHSQSPQEVRIDHNIGRSYFGTNAEPLLSVKCMFNGRARYVVDGRRSFVIDDASYVVLNQGNPYSIEKRSITPVETFCVFFPRQLTALLARDMTSPADALLDEPDETTASSFHFLEHCRSHGDRVSGQLMRMRRGIKLGHDVTDEWLDEQSLVLLAIMLESESTVRRCIDRLPRARHSTRLEMFRRVHLGRDYLHANLGRPVLLAEAAHAAAMSRFHFLRAFLAVFATTPRGYVTNERLRRAAALLGNTRLTVTDIAAQVGFASLTSFVNLFHRRFGVPPTHYRRLQTRNPR
jgi:AraC family transcriptional regulator